MTRPSFFNSALFGALIGVVIIALLWLVYVIGYVVGVRATYSS